jgi:rhamnosyltransferase
LKTRFQRKIGAFLLEILHFKEFSNTPYNVSETGFRREIKGFYLKFRAPRNFKTRLSERNVKAMLLIGRPRRAAIYFFYDKDGVVDNYISYQLSDLRRNVDYLLFVVNGRLTRQSRENINSYVDDLIIRENVEFDVGAYKAGIKFIGWDNLHKYDEFVMMNYTCFGPVYPFKEAFDWAASEDLDFWSLIKYGDNYYTDFKKTEHGYILGYIQSSFIVVRASLLRSLEFRQFWEHLPPINAYEDSATHYERLFVQRFINKGFKQLVYINPDYLHDVQEYSLMSYSKDLFNKFRCPVFKWSNFSTQYKFDTFGEHSFELLEFLKTQTDYDTDLVWQSIIRKDNLFDMHFQNHLNRILPKDYSILDKPDRARKVLLVMHIYYQDQIPIILKYCTHLPEYVDVLFTTADNAKKQIIAQFAVKVGLLNRYEVKLIENRGRDVSSILVGAADRVFDYDIVFAMHDKKSEHYEPYSIGLSWQHKNFENLLGSREYIENIITLFDEEPRMGMAFPPPPYGIQIFEKLIGAEWTTAFNATAKVLMDFKIKVSYSVDKQPIAPLGTEFVFRPLALKKLFAGQNGNGWSYEDFPKEPNHADGTLLHGIERAYTYFAQDAGYYPVWVINDHWAAIELDNYYQGWRLAKWRNWQLKQKQNKPVKPSHAKRFLQKLINTRATHWIGMTLWGLYRTIFPKSRRK